jgi:hypothetical protein
MELLTIIHHTSTLLNAIKPLKIKINLTVKPFKTKVGETSKISRKHDDLLGSWFHVYGNQKKRHDIIP